MSVPPVVSRVVGLVAWSVVIEEGLRDEREFVAQAIFDIRAERKFFIGGDRDQFAVGIEIARRIRKNRSGDDLSFARRRKPGTRPRVP